MTAHRGFALALALALLAAGTPARADVVLNGNFHTGDDDTKAEFTPLDPVECTKYRTYPSTFNLSEDATITGFTMHDVIDVQNAVITIDLDGVQRSALACVDCTLCSGATSCGDITVTLAASVALSAGDHTVAVVDPSGASGNCLSSNDFGWSGLTLLSDAGTTSIMLSQRRHLGDNADADDDYDFTGTVSTSNGEFYPDAFDGATLDMSFTLLANRRLTAARFYRLRDVNTESPNNATAPKVLVNGTQIGELTADGNPFTLTLANSLLLASGTHTLRVESGLLGAQRDDFTWDGIVLTFATTTASGTPGAFNAVDSGAAALTGSITTKVAGGAFTLDLYALNGFGTAQDATYAGTATVQVLNAADSSGAIDVYGCRSSWTVAQTLPGVATFVAGKATLSSTFLDAGLKDARIRVTDSTTGVQGCSIDNFAIRPASFGVAPSQGSETTAGLATALTNAGSSGLPRHRAGRPFTIVATALAANGNAATSYDGTPEASGVALAPATTGGTVTVTTWGSASNGVRQTDTAKYSEAGPVTLTLKDTTWASVDADDTVASQREISGSAATGRFVPDHFRVTEGSLAPGCAAGGFSYLGASLSWATPAVTLVAESADNTTTLNYEGALETLPDTLGAPTYASLTGTLDTAGLADPVIGAAVAGTATVTLPPLAFTRTLAGAFDAEIRIDLPAFADGDGIVPAESPIVLGALSSGGGIAFTGNAKSQRFGRLYFEPRYGSERLPMDVTLRAEYFDGVSFLHNTADACTALGTGDVTLTGIGGQTHTVSANGNGQWRVTLTAPNVPGQATLAVDLASPPVTPAVAYPLLRTDADGDGVYAEDAGGVATFGVYSQDQRWIYQREVIGN